MTNLVETIHEMGTFRTFTRALEMSGLAIMLREPGAYTVFAPTDAAFAQMKTDSLEDMFEDSEDLSQVVKYHIVVGQYRAENLLDVTFLKTLEGQRLIIRSSASTGPAESEKMDEYSDAHSFVIKDMVTTTLLESITVNSATITRGNVSASNGIVHVIDKVLVPRFMIL